MEVINALSFSEGGGLLCRQRRCCYTGMKKYCQKTHDSAKSLFGSTQPEGHFCLFINNIQWHASLLCRHTQITCVLSTVTTQYSRPRSPHLSCFLPTAGSKSVLPGRRAAGSWPVWQTHSRRHPLPGEPAPSVQTALLLKSKESSCQRHTDRT